MRIGAILTRPRTRLVRGIGRLVTMAGLGVVPAAAVVIEGERIAWAGPERDLPRDLAAATEEETDVGGALVTPGFIDAHTHPVYAVPRLAEISRRSDGATYLDIAREGGGIGATIGSTRALARDPLGAVVAGRVRAWRSAGTTTAEVKTGYHLNRDGEIGAVRLLAGLAREADTPDLAITLLAAHAVPPGEGLDGATYARLAASWSEEAAAAGAQYCDVFCDEGYFTNDEARLILEAGRAAGLLLRIHADELAWTGGARLAADLRAVSADHLLRCTTEDAAAMAAAGVVATLCPVTALSMGKTPPVAAFRANGVRMALGSDHNPGTSGVASMSLVVSLAVAGLGMPLGEALAAATTGGAASLAMRDRGRIEAGMRADLVAWDAEHEGAFAWAWGLPARAVWVGGRGGPVA